MATDKQLKKAATELNDVMGLTPAINVKGDTETLTKGIKAAMKHITPEDEFTDDTQAVIDEFTAKPAKAAAASPVKKKAPVVVEEDDEEDEEADDDDDDEEEVEEDEEEEIPEPPKKKKAAPVVEAPKKKKAPVVEEEDDDEEEEEEPVVVKKKKAAVPEPPTKKKKVVVEDEDEDEAPVTKKKKVVEEKKKSFVRAEYNRIDCLMIVLKTKKPKSIQDWIDKADDLFVSKSGGKSNKLQVLHLIKNYGKSLTYLGLDELGIKLPTK